LGDGSPGAVMLLIEGRASIGRRRRRRREAKLEMFETK
jgi:hypothetical protein